MAATMMACLSRAIFGFHLDPDALEKCRRQNSSHANDHAVVPDRAPLAAMRKLDRVGADALDLRRHQQAQASRASRRRHAFAVLELGACKGGAAISAAASSALSPPPTTSTCCPRYCFGSARR